jgi:hypothetical protein
VSQPPRESLASRILVPVVVAVLIALLIGGSAPWWLKFIFPDPTPTPSSSFVVPTSIVPTFGPSVTESLSPSQPTLQLTGCVLTITNPFVSMHESADIQSTETGDVPPGQYQTSNSTVVDFAGQSQRWFEITALGRTGWVMYNTIEIESKSAECP